MLKLFDSKTTTPSTTSPITSNPCRADFARGLERGVSAFHKLGGFGTNVYISGKIFFNDKDSMNAWNKAEMELYFNHLCAHPELGKYMVEYDSSMDNLENSIRISHGLHKDGIEILRNLLKEPSKEHSLESSFSSLTLG